MFKQRVMVPHNTKLKTVSERRPESRRVNQDEIRVDDEWEVIYWCRVLKCTKENLMETVGRYGSSPSVIRAMLEPGHRDN
jgi:hypothetical protein